jgi:hypothetical protein
LGEGTRWQDARAGRGPPERRPGPEPEPGTIRLTIATSFEPERVAAVCRRVQRIVVAGTCRRIECTIEGSGHDLAIVDLLARLWLIARRQRCTMQIRHRDEELVGLMGLVGIASVLPVGPIDLTAPASQARRETEHGEQTLGVEEEADPGDRSV